MGTPSFNSDGTMTLNGSAGSGLPKTSSEQVWLNGPQSLTANARFGTTSAHNIDLFAGSGIARGRITSAGQLSWGGTINGTGENATFRGNVANPWPLTVYGTGLSTGGGIWGEIPSGSTSFAAVTGSNQSTGAGSGPGVLGVASNSSSPVGVYGVCDGNGGTGQGVEGHSRKGTGSITNGVYGHYGPGFGAGVLAVGWNGVAPGGNIDYGVVGVRAINTNYSGYFIGNHAVASGTKSASVGTSKGNQLLFVVESPEVWFEDIGSGQLRNGRATITLDPLFLETVLIDAKHSMRVFLQEEGESQGLYVVPGTTSFEVREKFNGRSNISFGYKVMAKRKHFADHRFGNDPVWGPGDTRKYMFDARTPSIDYATEVAQEAQERAHPRDVQLPATFRNPPTTPTPTRPPH